MQLWRAKRLETAWDVPLISHLQVNYLNSCNLPKWQTFVPNFFWQLICPIWLFFMIWILPSPLSYLNTMVNALSGETTLWDFVGVHTQQITHGKYLTPPTFSSPWPLEYSHWRCSPPPHILPQLQYLDDDWDLTFLSNQTTLWRCDLSL